MALVLVLVPSFLVNTHFIWTVDIQNSTEGELTCQPFPDDEGNRSVIIQFLTVTANSFLPYAITVILNVLMVYKLRSTDKRISSYSKQNSARLLSKSLILMSFSFVILFFPLRFYYIFALFHPYVQSIPFLRSILALIGFGYYSFSFLLYILIGNQLRDRLSSLKMSFNRLCNSNRRAEATVDDLGSQKKSKNTF